MRERLPILGAWAAFGLFWGGWGALLPAIKDATGATESQLGFALLFIAAGALLAMSFTGALVDRFGDRVLVFALVLFAGAVVLPALVSSVAALALTLLIVGAASGALDIAMTAGVVAVELRRDVRMMARAHGMFALSAVVGSVAVGVAREAGAGRLSILAVMAAVMLSIAAAKAAVLRGSPPGARESARGRGWPPRVTRLLAVVGVLYALALLVENALEQWSAIHVEETLGGTPVAGGLAPALFALGLFVGRMLAPLYERRVREAAVVGLAACGGAAGLLITAFADALGLALAGMFATGLLLAPAAPTLISFAGRTAADAESGSAVATATTIGYLGYLLGPVFVGSIAGLAGLRAGLAAVAGVAVALAVAALFVFARAARSGP